MKKFEEAQITIISLAQCDDILTASYVYDPVTGGTDPDDDFGAPDNANKLVQQ